jgi:hypothetical protein
MDVASLISCAQDYSREALRQKLLHAYERLLLLSQTKSTGSWTSFDETFLCSAVRNIDWRELCFKFDSWFAIQDALRSSARSLFESTNSSLLDVLLECFEDPSIWPCACASLFVVLWEVLCSSGRRFTGSLSPDPVNLLLDRSMHQLPATLEQFKWTPSQVRILNHMTNKILRQNPAMLSISYWMQRVSVLFHDEQFTAECYDIVLLVLRHWSVEFPSHQMLWLTLLATVMAAVDEKEFHLIQKQKLMRASEKNNFSFFFKS